ncbi:ArsR/SmtB family transcription factor [Mycolicibacterium sphagni]|nr:metalloregulator ArsR/SmtB family transcription factor [Mycolicibacterium sphagni]
MPKPPPTAKTLPAEMLQDTASMFGLLSASVRLHILWLLADGEQDVTSLAAACGQSVATVSHHLGKLKLAGLVDVRRHGRRHVYVATEPHVIEVVVLAINTRLAQKKPRTRRRAFGS